LIAVVNANREYGVHRADAAIPALELIHFAIALNHVRRAIMA
jgi:hypothetical protein